MAALRPGSLGGASETLGLSLGDGCVYSSQPLHRHCTCCPMTLGWPLESFRMWPSRKDQLGGCKDWGSQSHDPSVASPSPGGEQTGNHMPIIQSFQCNEAKQKLLSTQSSGALPWLVTHQRERAQELPLGTFPDTVLQASCLGGPFLIKLQS